MATDLPTFILKREILSNKATLGTLTNPKGLEIAKTLELPFMDNKRGISCIPFGQYNCVKDTTGRFKHWKVLNVEGREAIEFHEGNYTTDTDGCILLAQSHVFARNDKTNQIEQALSPTSRATFKKLKENSLVPDKFVLNIVS